MQLLAFGVRTCCFPTAYRPTEGMGPVPDSQTASQRVSELWESRCGKEVKCELNGSAHYTGMKYLPSTSLIFNEAFRGGDEDSLTFIRPVYY